MADERTFSQTEHTALLTDAVTRETASLTTAKEDLEHQVSSLQAEKASAETALADLQAKLDVVEAEKANAEKAAADAKAEHEAYIAELTEIAAVEGRKADRVARIKAANSTLADTYFTEDRAARWAQMADEVFDALVADITEAAAATGNAQTPEEKAAAEKAAADKTARETAAFTGGAAPTSGTGSVFGQFLTATGHGPRPAVNA